MSSVVQTPVLQAIDRYFMGPAPAARLGALRVLVGGFAMIYIIARLPHFMSYGGFSPAQYDPVGVVWLLCDTPLPNWSVTALTLVTAALALPFFLGWRMRVIGPLFALLYLWTISYRNSWGMVFHTENLLCLHVLILGVSASADAWSLDARRRGQRSGQRSADDRAASGEHGRYRWPIKLMCWVVVIAYVLAGVAKMQNGGMSWLWGDELRNHVALDNARKLLLGDIHSPLAAPLMHWDALWKLLATMTVVLELGAPIALLGARLALVWVLAVIGFHLGVLALMMIAFPYQMVGVSFACFFRAEKLLEWAHARWRRRRSQKQSLDLGRDPGEEHRD